MTARVSHLLVLASLLAAPLQAQARAPQPQPTTAAAPEHRAERDPKPARRWRASSVVELGSEYDDNSYLLRDGARNDLATPSASAAASGRFADMNSAAGATASVALGARLRGPGLGGRPLELRPELAYAADALNAARRAFGVGVTAIQSRRNGNSLRLAAQVTPGYFARNYMVDAIDLSGDGTIASAERVYAAARYRDVDVAVAYRRRLDKSTKSSPFGASVQAGGGYYARTYDAPFAGRDMRGPTADARLLLALSRRLDLDVSYGFASLASTPTEQVLVIDEPDADRDLNGNGTAGDRNVRVAALTDRSRTAHTLGARATIALSKRSELRLETERRMRAFSSSEPLDFANNGRRDTRDTFGARYERQLRTGAALWLRGEHSLQRLARDLAAGMGEIDDYSRNRLAVGVRFGR